MGDMLPAPDSREITSLLNQVRKGDQDAANRLMDHLYKQLRQLAAHYMRSERPDHTLQPTALVHEAYLRIFGSQPITWQNRAHFFAVAARQMRRVLVDHARRAGAGKRGGRAVKVTLDEASGLSDKCEEDLGAIDEVLDRLEKIDARAARVVELRFFSGLTDKETAAVLGVAVGSVRRDWEFARAWLFSELRPAHHSR
jgi:RNA polymerase sigma factor (TIGR02999 family)